MADLLANAMPSVALPACDYFIYCMARNAYAPMVYMIMIVLCDGAFSSSVVFAYILTFTYVYIYRDITCVLAAKSIVNFELL